MLNNTLSDGSLDNNKAAREILQYRNTPLNDIHLSPAQIFLHRHIRDYLPTHPHHYHLHPEWLVAAQEREQHLAQRNHIILKRYNSSAHTSPLDVGTHVAVQNQGHTRARKWDRTGHITEVLPHSQYHVRMERSGCITLRNRRFVRE